MVIIMDPSTDFKKKYPEHWVVMQNTIMQCFKEMTKDEKRLIVLASPVARIIDATEKDAIEITAENFAESCNIKISSAYKQLEEASKTLMKRSFTYKNEKGKRVAVQWVIRAIYDEGCIRICFPDEVLLMLKVFDDLNPYTKYKKENILSLKLSYSIDLYHLAKKFEGMGGFSMSLDDYRQELGTPKSYERINNLKENAVDNPIKEINEKTDIKITYKNIKRGRTVTGLKFTVKAKPIKKKGLADLNQNNENRDIAPLTVKQIDRFAPLLANYSPFGSYAPQGKSTPEVISWLHTQLRDEAFLKTHKKHLLAVGYTHPKQKS